jgi:hypothetical protein
MPATARKEASLVDRATLSLLEVPIAPATVSVARVSEGFAVLDFASGPKQVALDFLPTCAAGDVLELQPVGKVVRIAVDHRATHEARARLMALWKLVAPQ